MKTGLKRKRRAVSVVAVAAMIVLCAVSPQCPVRHIVSSRQARTCLLCEVDHQALLEAGREVLSQVTNGHLRYGSYLVRDGCLPNGFCLPQAVADLGPRRILAVEEGYLMIEIRGGIDQFGVNVYPADFKQPFSGFPCGDRKLIDGLWYFDAQYKWPDYAESIDKMLRKCGRGGN